MSIETYEEREREREKEVRRASMKRARNQRDLDDEDQPERRSAVSDYIEEKPVTKKNAKAANNAAREQETSSLATYTCSAITSRPSVSSGLLSSTSGATYAAATKANNGLRSKGSTLKSLFPMTALPLSSDDDQSLVGAAPSAKKTKKDKPKKARKSKGKGKKRLSAEMADDEEENTQKENKENSSTPTTSGGGSQIKKRKFLPAGKDDQVSLATPPSLASSAGELALL